MSIAVRGIGRTLHLRSSDEEHGGPACLCGMSAFILDANHTVLLSFFPTENAELHLSTSQPPLTAWLSTVGHHCTHVYLVFSPQRIFSLGPSLSRKISGFSLFYYTLSVCLGCHQESHFHTETCPTVDTCFEFWHSRRGCLMHTWLCLLAACSSSVSPAAVRLSTAVHVLFQTLHLLLHQSCPIHI